jgi:hypothetical protein
LSDGEAPGVAAIGRLCACLGSARARAMRVTPPGTHRRGRPLRPFGLGSHLCNRQRRARSGRLSLLRADPLVDHGIPSLAQSGQRRPHRVRQPSRSLAQIDYGRAVGSPHEVDHQRQLAAVSRGARMRLSSTYVARITASLRLRKRLRLRRLAWLDRLFRSFRRRRSLSTRPLLI